MAKNIKTFNRVSTTIGSTTFHYYTAVGVDMDDNLYSSNKIPRPDPATYQWFSDYIDEYLSRKDIEEIEDDE